MSDDEVTLWIEKLTQGDQTALQPIWERYFDQLVRLARKKLEGLPRRVADEEDVALSAMDSFCRAAAAGRYPQLKARDDLWKLLVTITAHKAVKQFRRQRAQKRGGGHVRGESALRSPGPREGTRGIHHILGQQPTPELAAIMAETVGELLDELDDETLQQIALAKMEGRTNAEIADHLNCALRTIQRKLGQIRKIWEHTQQSSRNTDA